MFKYLVLLLAVCFSAFGTETQLVALGQPTSGSFYLNDNRNFLRNPATLNQSQVSYDVKERDLIYQEADFAVAGGKLESGSSSVLGAYKFMDVVGASVRASVRDGKFFDDSTFGLGVDMDRVEAYLRFNSIKNGNDSFTGGLVFPMEAYTLFGEYSAVDNADDLFLVGLSRVFKRDGMISPFADVTYRRASSKNQDLELTAGLMADVFKDLNVYTSLKHDFVFDSKSTLAGGFDYLFAKNFCLGTAFSVSAFTKDSLKYSDVGTKLSLTYSL